MSREHPGSAANVQTAVVAEDFVLPKVTSPGGSSTSSRDGSPNRDVSPLTRNLNPPVVLKRGTRGFGFGFRSVRVYIGETDVYTLQHIVTVSASVSGRQQFAVFTISTYKRLKMNSFYYRLDKQCAHFQQNTQEVKNELFSIDQTKQRTHFRQTLPSTNGQRDIKHRMGKKHLAQCHC